MCIDIIILFFRSKWRKNLKDKKLGIKCFVFKLVKGLIC